MKLVLNGTQEFEVNKKPRLTGDPLSFSLCVDDPATIPTEITGEIVLKDTIVWPKTGLVEEGVDPSEGEEAQDFTLFTTTAEEWMRHYVEGNVLYFTNIPEPQPAPPPTEEEIAAQLERAKEEAIANTKTGLADFLARNPLTWVDGEQYNVTQEKQSLLTSQLALYTIAQQSGTPYELRWNTTGGECTVWTLENLSALALSIGAYVKPFVSYQQAKEVEIRACKTMDELYSVVVDYGSLLKQPAEAEKPDEAK